jgi:predicted transcriptional regulator
MRTKAAKRSRPDDPSYAPEDLEPRDAVHDEAALDAYLTRNKNALNASIKRAESEFERGEYFTLEQAMADVRAQQQRRIRKI